MEQALMLSPDAIRQDIAERRERLLSLQVNADAYRAEAERLEGQLAFARGQIEAADREVLHEREVIEALESAAALLSERLPIEPIVAVAEVVEASADELPALEPGEPAPGSSDESEDEPQGGESHEVGGVRIRPGAIERVQGRRIVLKPAKRPRPVPADKRRRPRRRSRTVELFAEELDVAAMSAEERERADTVMKLLLAAAGPLHRSDVARWVERELNVSPGHAGRIVRTSLAALVVLGRVRNGEVNDTWEPTPSERASAGLGAGTDFEGRTTKWPTASTTPVKGTRIKIEEGSYEGGKR